MRVESVSTGALLDRGCENNAILGAPVPRLVDPWAG